MLDMESCCNSNTIYESVLMAFRRTLTGFVARSLGGSDRWHWVGDRDRNNLHLFVLRGPAAGLQGLREVNL